MYLSFIPFWTTGWSLRFMASFWRACALKDTPVDTVSDGAADGEHVGWDFVTAGEDVETGSVLFIWLLISPASVLFLVHIYGGFCCRTLQISFLLLAKLAFIPHETFVILSKCMQSSVHLMPSSRLWRRVPHVARTSRVAMAGLARNPVSHNKHCRACGRINTSPTAASRHNYQPTTCDTDRQLQYIVTSY